MVVISYSKKGFGFYGITAPWSMWGGAVLGSLAVEAGRRSTPLESTPGTRKHGILNATGFFGGAVGGYLFAKWLNN